MADIQSIAIFSGFNRRKCKGIGNKKETKTEDVEKR